MGTAKQKRASILHIYGWRPKLRVCTGTAGELRPLGLLDIKIRVNLFSGLLVLYYCYPKTLSFFLVTRNSTFASHLYMGSQLLRPVYHEQKCVSRSAILLPNLNTCTCMDFSVLILVLRTCTATYSHGHHLASPACQPSPRALSQKVLYTTCLIVRQGIVTKLGLAYSLITSHA